MENTDQRIKDLIADATGYEWDEIKPGDDLVSDLGMDSLDLAKLEIEAEDVLHIDIELHAFKDVRTVEQLVSRLEDLVGSRGVF